MRFLKFARTLQSFHLAPASTKVIAAKFLGKWLITDRVRSTRGGYIFSLFVCSHLGGGGGGYPIPGPGGGGGVPPSQVQGGYPISGPGGGGGVPHPLMGGTPSYPPQQGYPPPFRSDPRMEGGGYPLQEQHSVYLLHRGRYASCVHAGGLSCSHAFLEKY